MTENSLLNIGELTLKLNKQNNQRNRQIIDLGYLHVLLHQQGLI